MLTSQRWADEKQCCPVGIKIYLSQVTPIGNKQLDQLFSHTHTRSCLELVHTYLQQRTCTQALQHTVYVCQVWRLLQRLLSCLFNIPVSWSPSLISCCVRACELTSCWITAFTYHTCQHGTQQPALLTHFYLWLHYIYMHILCIYIYIIIANNLKNKMWNCPTVHQYGPCLSHTITPMSTCICTHANIHTYMHKQFKQVNPPPCHSLCCIKKEHVETQRDQMLECFTMHMIKSIPAGTKGGPVAV